MFSFTVLLSVFIKPEPAAAAASAVSAAGGAALVVVSERNYKPDWPTLGQRTLWESLEQGSVSLAD